MNRTDAYQLLQIPRSADEREIKRAYARLLKKTRPDDDAAAFQRLQEAYEACLDQARRRPSTAQENAARAAHATESASFGYPEAGESGDAGHEDADSGVPPRSPAIPPQGRPMEHPDPGDRPPARPARIMAPPHPIATPAPTPRFDVQAFVERLYVLFDSADPRPMRDWLHAHPALYSVELKHTLRPVVVRALHDAPSLGDGRAVTTVLEFFGLDKLDRDGQAANAQAVLENRERHARLARLLRRMQLSSQDVVERMAARELTGQRNRLRRLFLMLVPTAPTRIAGFIHTIRQLQPRLDHAELDPPSIQFWEQATDPHRLARPRVATALLRVLVWFGAFFGFLALLVSAPDDQAALFRGFLTWTTGTAGTWFAFAVLRIGWARANEWSWRHWRLPPGMLFGASAVIVGLCLSWIPVAGPLPAALGLLAGYVRPALGRGRLRLCAAFAGPLIMSACALANLEPYTALLGPDRTLALAATFAALPLIVQYWLDRRLPPHRWAGWVVPIATGLFLVATQMLAVLNT